MAGNIDTVSHSLTDSHRGSDTVLLCPSLENVRSSTEAADMSATVSSLPCLPITLDGGPCSTVPASSDAELLPPSCVVEDDEPLALPREHHHRHRRHRGRRHHRFCRVRWKEVNFVAAMLNVVAAVLVCTALAEPRWWYIGGSPCLDYDQHASYLGVKQFLYKGFFVERSTSTPEEHSKYYYGTLPSDGG